MFDHFRLWKLLDAIPKDAEDLSNALEKNQEQFIEWKYSNVNGDVSATFQYKDPDGNITENNFKGTEDEYKENLSSFIKSLGDTSSVENKTEETDDWDDYNADDEYVDGLKVGESYTDPNGFVYHYDQELGSWVYDGEANRKEDNVSKFAVASSNVYQPKVEFKNTEDLKEEISAEDDAINHPSHYTVGKYEVIDYIIQEYGYDFLFQNVIKYVSRAGHKSDPVLSDEEKYIEDMKKAKWYLERYLDREEPPAKHKKIYPKEYAKDKGFNKNVSGVIDLLHTANINRQNGYYEKERMALELAKNKLDLEITFKETLLKYNNDDE